MRWIAFAFLICPGCFAQSVYVLGRQQQGKMVYPGADAKTTLLIGNRQGNFPGMLKERKINIVLVEAEKAVGADPNVRPDKTAAYAGKSASIKYRHPRTGSTPVKWLNISHFTLPGFHIPKSRSA